MYEELICWFNDNEISFPFKDDPADLKKAFLKQSGLKGKESAIKECLLDGKFFKTDNLDLSIFIRLLASGTVKISALFCKDDYQELEKDAVCIANADFDDRVPELSAQLDDGHVDLLRIVKNLYDWSVLMAMLDTERT